MDVFWPKSEQIDFVNNVSCLVLYCIRHECEIVNLDKLLKKTEFPRCEKMRLYKVEVVFLYCCPSCPAMRVTLTGQPEQQ